MKIERLRNKKSKLIFLCGCLMVVVLLITAVIQGSRAKYRSSQIIPLITNKKVTNKVPDFTVMGIYIYNTNGAVTGKDGKRYDKKESTYTMPSEGFVINEKNSYCQKFNGTTSTDDPNVKFYTDIFGNHSLKGVSSGDKCYIFFDVGTKNLSVSQFLLHSWGYDDLFAITERTDFGTVRTDGGNKVYKALDDYGTSYYLVGNPQNNWVKFAGYLWRIVRINGNGTLRLLYYGNIDANNPNGIVDSIWEDNEGYPWLVGFTYEYGLYKGHKNGTKAIMRVSEFYLNSLMKYDSYVDKNTGFCNDRSIISGDGVSINVDTVFSAKQRLVDSEAPILTCPDKNSDLFTVGTANNGNKRLTYPIGLITGDELMMSGMIYGGVGEEIYQVFTGGVKYYTMTPLCYGNYSGNYLAVMFGVGWNSALGIDYISDIRKIRPVINLIKDVNFSKGNGTKESPFEI